jgi:hypothetical protein
MLIRPVLAFFALCATACLAQASEIVPELPSLALNPPPPPSWSGLDEMGQFAPYAASGVGAATANAGSGVVRTSGTANNLVNSSGSLKAASPGALDYDLGGNVHMHLGIAGGAMTEGIIRH